MNEAALPPRVTLRLRRHPQERLARLRRLDVRGGRLRPSVRQPMQACLERRQQPVRG